MFAITQQHLFDYALKLHFNLFLESFCKWFKANGFALKEFKEKLLFCFHGAKFAKIEPVAEKVWTGGNITEFCLKIGQQLLKNPMDVEEIPTIIRAFLRSITVFIVTEEKTTKKGKSHGNYLDNEFKGLSIFADRTDAAQVNAYRLNGNAAKRVAGPEAVISKKMKSNGETEHHNVETENERKNTKKAIQPKEPQNPEKIQTPSKPTKVEDDESEINLPDSELDMENSLPWFSNFPAANTMIELFADSVRNAVRDSTQFYFYPDQPPIAYPDILQRPNNPAEAAQRILVEAEYVKSQKLRLNLIKYAVPADEEIELVTANIAALNNVQRKNGDPESIRLVEKHLMFILSRAIFCAAKVEKLAEFNRRVSLTSDPCLLYHITVGVPSLLRFSLDEFSTKIDDQTKDAIKELAVVVHDLKNPK